METFFIKIFNMAFTASFLILAVILFRLIFKKVPKSIICILWGLVAIRLVLPFSFESILSLIPSSEPIPENIMMDQIPTIQSGISSIDDSVNQSLAENYVPQLGASVNPMQIQMFISSSIWFMGMIVILLYGVISYLILLHKVRASMVFQDNIRLCDDIPSPFILGIVRPVIYLPSDTGEDQMKYVIAHEKMHIKRMDHWWKPLGFLLLSVYWFCPLVWVAYWLLCRDIEYACDESVIKKLDYDGIKAYSSTLLECSVTKKQLALCPLAFGEVGVKQRINALLNFKKPALWLIIVSLICGIFVIAFFMTDPMDKDLYKLWLIEGEAGELKSVAHMDHHNIYYYGVSEAKIMVDGAYLDLMDAIDRDVNLIEKLLENAAAVAKIEMDESSGSVLYRLKEYTILEMKTKINVIPVGRELLLEDINQSYDMGIIIGYEDMQYEELKRLFLNRQVDSEELQENLSNITEYDGALLPLKYGGEDINGNTSNAVMREYYQNFSIRDNEKMKHLFADAWLERNLNSKKSDISLQELEHCEIVNITLLKKSDKELFEQLAKRYFACCLVQTSDTILCNEDCSFGSKGETVYRNYAYLLVRENEQSPWQIYDCGYPPYYVPET